METHSDTRRRVRRALLTWFRRWRRDLPWRASRDPYRIWVSEIMLQQTQVATVIPFFERFLIAFPTLADLAMADEHDVLRLWEGLGYYRRARNLHRAARLVVEESRGEVPRDPAALARLPGIGRYTLGAILSQAFDCRLPILEANSQRVLCRLFGIKQNPTKGKVRRRLWNLAEELLPARHVGDFNQALMELGALVCSPISPRCSECPLAKLCAARRLGIQEKIPCRIRGPDSIEVQEAAVVVRRNGHVLVVQRPEWSRWAGLWEFPHAPLQKGETHVQAANRLLRDLTNIQAEIGPELQTVRHSVTHHRITLVCFEARYRAGKFRSDFYHQGEWIRPARLSTYPVSSPQRRLAACVSRQRDQGNRSIVGSERETQARN
jgi:A/G-specific adenine glycosylase